MSASQRGAAHDTAPPSPRRRVATRPAARVVRRRATVRRVDPWSVCKLSLVFYFCVLLIAMLGLTLLWAVVIRMGLIEALQDLLEKVGLQLVQVNGANIARAVFLVGLVNVVVWSGINVFMAFLYNLIADLVGGLKVTLAEDDLGR